MSVPWKPPTFRSTGSRLDALRNTFASHAVQFLRGGSRITELDVAWMLGHTNADLVRHRYGHALKYVVPRADALEFEAADWVHLPDLYARLELLYERAGVASASSEVPCLVQI